MNTMSHLNHSLLNQLHDEHMITMSVLERVDGLLRRQRPNNPPGADDGECSAALTALSGVLKEEITSHFAFEEGHLFPRFSERAEPGIPMMLKAEHDVIRPLAQELTELIKAGLGGFSAEGWAEFHAKAGELIERETFHIQKEEMGFLPALDYMLDETEAAELSMAYAESKG